MKQRMAVVISKPIPPIIASPNELGTSRLKINFAVVYIQTQIATANLDAVSACDLDDFIYFRASTKMKPMIETVRKTIDPVLRICKRKTREQRATFIRDAVMVAIEGNKDLGGACDNDAISPRVDAG